MREHVRQMIDRARRSPESGDQVGAEIVRLARVAVAAHLVRAAELNALPRRTIDCVPGALEVER